MVQVSFGVISVPTKRTQSSFVPDLNAPLPTTTRTTPRKSQTHTRETAGLVRMKALRELQIGLNLILAYLGCQVSSVQASTKQTLFGSQGQRLPHVQ